MTTINLYAFLFLLALNLHAADIQGVEINQVRLGDDRSAVEEYFREHGSAFAYAGDTLSVKFAPFGYADSADCLVLFRDDKVVGIYYPNLTSKQIPDELRNKIYNAESKQTLSTGIVNAFFKDGSVCLAECGGRAILWITTPITAQTQAQPAQEANSEEVQCKATTKKGTRCKRLTKSKNGLCWQHGGE